MIAKNDNIVKYILTILIFFIIGIIFIETLFHRNTLLEDIIYLVIGIGIIIFGSWFGEILSELLKIQRTKIMNKFNIEDNLARILVGDLGGTSFKSWIIRIIGTIIVMGSTYHIIQLLLK